MTIADIGAAAADFALADATGTMFRLRQLLEAGPVGLLFIKSGCGASELAAPAVEALWRGYEEHVSAESTRLSILGVSQDDGETTLRFAAGLGLTFRFLIDADLAVSRAYQLEVTPTFLLLRGAERLRSDAVDLPASADFRIVDVIEGWSRDAYQLLSEEIAARVGALPVDLPAVEVPFRPG